MMTRLRTILLTPENVEEVSDITNITTESLLELYFDNLYEDKSVVLVHSTTRDRWCMSNGEKVIRGPLKEG